MKPNRILQILLIIIALCLFSSCASSAPSSDPCAFQPYKKTTKKQKVPNPPHQVTPIGGNYKIRN